MSAVGFRSGLAALTDAGTLRSSCCASAPETLSEPSCRFVPLNIEPPWNWFVPVRLIMLKTRPPVDASAGELPARKFASSNA
jgi:hypothetical protein